MSLQACTIATLNLLAEVRVLARSLTEHHAGSRLTVLMPGDQPPGPEPFDVLAPADIHCPPMDAMVTAYRPIEIACAVKPWLLMHLLADGPAALWLDSDSRIYAPLDDIAEAAARDGLVLTRHLLGPLPRDGRRPSEDDILVAGVYNGGFLAVGDTPEAQRFLRWWASRLAEECHIAPERGHFFDQRWLDFAGAFIPSVQVLDDPGVNFGFWDVPNRPLSGEPGAFRIGDRPLRCFHFSGFDATEPDVLSHHQDRVDLADHPALTRLCRDYADEMLEAGEGDAVPPPPPLTPLIRTLYRRGRAAGALRAPVLSRQDLEDLEAWLREPAESGGWAGLTRYLLALRDAEPELTRRFPDLDGPDAVAYADWARTVAGRHAELPVEVAPAAIMIDGHHLEPLLLELFARQAVPLPQFLAWLAEPAPEGAEHGATRYLYELHLARPDLRAAFPVIGPELVTWAREIGVHEHPLLGELLYASSERAGAGSLE